MLVDIDPGTYTIDPSCLEDTIKRHGGSRRSAVSGRVKAIIPVHLYGHPAEMPVILDLAGRHGLFVIEDCAQSHGSATGGRKTGAWGHLAAFSFYPTKNLGALGDGGAVVTGDPDLAEKVRLLREYGWRTRYVSELPGMNTRLDEVQAAILRAKLRHLDAENRRRREIARMYDAMVAATPLILPRPRGDVEHVFHQYVVRCRHRDDLRAFLKEHSIDTLIHYPMPVHLQPAYNGRVVIGEGGLQRTEEICREVLSLPIHPQMTDEQAQRVRELVIRWCGRGTGER